MNINNESGMQIKVSAEPRFGADIASESDAVSFRPKKKKKKKVQAFQSIEFN